MIMGSRGRGKDLLRCLRIIGRKGNWKRQLLRLWMRPRKIIRCHRSQPLTLKSIKFLICHRNTNKMNKPMMTVPLKS